MAGKYYAVKKGRTPGIYHTWDACKAQVSGFSGAVYKSFQTEKEALDYMEKGSGECTDSKTLEEARKDPDITVAYVDGSYYDKTKEFSYGMVIVEGDKEYSYGEKVTDFSLVSMRNVAGEIKGAQAAMEYAFAHHSKKLIIYHDYEGIAKWCLGEWQVKKEGTKAYKAVYDQMKKQMDIEFRKVTGHSGDHYNDMADQAAKRALGLL